MAKNTFFKIFTPRNLAFLFLFATLGFMIRLLLTHYLELDLNEYLQYLVAYLPSAIGSKLAVALLEGYYSKETIDTSGSSVKGIKLFSNGQASGSGSGNNLPGSGSGSGNNPPFVNPDAGSSHHRENNAPSSSNTQSANTPPLVPGKTNED
jgi:hypothetical protein